MAYRRHRDSTNIVARLNLPNMQEGRQEGEQRGVQKGESLVLLRQLRLKFGEIPDEIRLRIEEADADTLLTWSERILTAERIEDVVR
jgi:predicted transposase YdaD